MVLEKRFCTNCGTPLKKEDRFCSSCGQQVQAFAEDSSSLVQPLPQPTFNPYQTAPTPPFQPQPPVSGEHLIGVIPSVSRKKGLIGVEGFNIIVTQHRMIFAVMTSDMIKEEAKRVSKGAGFFGGVMLAAGVGYNFYKRYLTMSPDAALAESQENFAFELSLIRKVKIEAGKEIKTYQSSKSHSMVKQHQYENGKIEIETTRETIKFNLPNSSLEMAIETARKAGLTQ